MARWRLTAKHYLNATQDGEASQWVREETNRDTGRTKRQSFNVPLYLDPDDPTMQTPRGSGEIIVAWAGKGYRHDIVFVGQPTAEMEPLDDEAEAITEAERHNWIHPIESLPGQGFEQNLLAMLRKQLEDAMNYRPIATTQPIVVQGVDIEEFRKMQEQLAELMAQNLELQAKVVKRV